MKLLFDENLSYKLARNLADLFPDSRHARDCSLAQIEDRTIWDGAKQEEFTIVTKDEDFSVLALLHGSPPKVIWIQLGNCSTGQIESLIRWRIDAIREFLDNPDLSVLALR